MRMVRAVAGLALGAIGCAHATTIEKVDVDTYHVTCREASLGRCLSENVTNVCDGRAYFVRGISEINRRGHSESPDLATSSEAILRCSNGDNWGEEGKALLAAASPSSPMVATAPSAPATSAPTPPKVAPAPPPTSASAATPPPICTPGSTQSCVGPGACPGGQACKADGSGYEPCDCGAAAAPH